MLQSKQSDSVFQEEFFLRHYGQMFFWAMQLTGHDRDRAEDLVHDVFIQFTLSCDPRSIQNVEGYLYTMLKNMHLARIRQAARFESRDFSIIDYDSAESGLQTVGDVRDRMEAQDELRRICHYACVRKESSKAASVLALRFFHGYYPSEIARVMKSSRQAVTVWQRIARREARLYLENPNALSFISNKATEMRAQSDSPRPSDDLLTELRNSIFRSRQGSCVTPEQLRQIYGEGEKGVESAMLAHIVSCVRCLDRVNKLLGLPLLVERYPLEDIDQDKPPKGGAPDDSDKSGGDEGGTRRALKRYGEGLRKVFEHTPNELRVSVNGFEVGSQRVSAESNELRLSFMRDEKVGFVEVQSEQRVRLLSLCVEPPPDGPAERRAHVALSDGRALSLSLSFKNPWPALHVVYHDPTYVAEGQLLEFESEAEETLAFKREARYDLIESQRPQFSLRALFGASGLYFRPGLVTAVIATILIAALVFTRFIWRPTSAAELLERSADLEASATAQPLVALRRTIDLEERQLGSDIVVSRKRIEVWQSYEKRIKARRLYNERSELIAGEWTRADSSRTLYQPGAKARIRPEPAPGSPFDLDEAWRHDLSAKDFGRLIGNSARARVEKKPAAYVISFENDAVAGAGGPLPVLLSATLTLNKGDLHPVEQRLVIESGGERREYRFLEMSYERRPASAVAPAVFEPEPELLSSNRLIERNGERTTLSPSPGPTALPTPVVATAELEIEVLHLLSRAGADSGEQVSVVRGLDGALRVEGIVDTERRKNEILRALGPVADNPALTVAVITAAEALDRRAQRPSGPLTIQQIEQADGKIPAYQELRRHFIGRGMTEAQVDAEILRFSDQMLGRSRKALLRAGALKRLVNRFSEHDLLAIDTEARTKWRAMIQAHARIIERETTLLRQELGSIFFPAPQAAPLAEPAITDDAVLADAAGRLFALCSTIERGINQAFTLSSNSTSGVAINTPEFRRALASAEDLASKVRNWSVAGSQ